MREPLLIEYIDGTDLVSIEGVKYSVQAFRDLRRIIPGDIVQVTDRMDDIVHLRIISGQEAEEVRRYLLRFDLMEAEERAKYLDAELAEIRDHHRERLQQKARSVQWAEGLSRQAKVALIGAGYDSIDEVRDGARYGRITTGSIQEVCDARYFSSRKLPRKIANEIAEWAGVTLQEPTQKDAKRPTKNQIEYAKRILSAAGEESA